MSLPGDSTLFMLGISHQTAALETRERLLLAGEGLERFFLEAINMEEIGELVMLSTCNRIEFYGVGKNTMAVENLARNFCIHAGAGLSYETEFKEMSRTLLGNEVIRHLISVCAGLDSQLLGETEVFGQVKEAYAKAKQLGGVGKILNKVFQRAFHAAKQIRTRTRVGLGHVSVAGVSVDLARRIFGDLEGARVLLLGAGDVAEKVSRAFLGKNVRSLAVANRTAERAMELAGELDVTALPWARIGEHLWEYSIVVGSTASEHAVISKKVAELAMKRRPTEPLFFIDLGMPRDFEAGVSEIENVFLYNLDDIARIASENLSAKEEELEKGRKITAEKAHSIWENLQSASSKSTPNAGQP